MIQTISKDASRRLTIGRVGTGNQQEDTTARGMKIATVAQHDSFYHTFTALEATIYHHTTRAAHSLFTNGPTWVFPAFCIFANVSNIDHTVNEMTAIMQSSMAT